ncbi:MAG: FecR family protein [Planctomycetota bacterium]|nr:FecR family protein [Planctomycetota bacterium]
MSDQDHRGRRLSDQSGSDQSGSDQSGSDRGPDALWLDYLEGDLSESGMEALRQSFESDPGARAGRVETLRLHRELGLALSGTARERAGFVAATMDRLPAEVGGRRPLLTRAVAIGAALAAALLGAILLAGSGAEPAPVLRVIESAGAVEWVAGGGQAEPLPAPGAALPGGVLALRGPDAWAELAFNDGSTITLTGIARATISDEGQKVIALDGGRLLAEVAPQGQRPMRVFTAAAEIAVLGTRFRVQASEERATLDVTEGRVEMRRHVDGQRVEVAAGEFAVATPFAGDAFHPRMRPEPTGSWSASLRDDPTQGRFVIDLEALKAELFRAVKRGELTEEEALERFLAADGGLEAVALWKKAARSSKPASKLGGRRDLKGSSASAAEAEIEAKKGGAWGNLVAAGPVSAGGDSAPVLLTNDSRVLVTGWVARPTRLTVGLTLAQADRSYAGKVSFTSDVLPGGAFFELDLSCADFARLEQTKGGLRARGEGLSSATGGVSGGQASGSIIEDWWCAGHSLESGLKIRQVEIQPGEGKTR